jgi:hypothetical protein
MCWRDTSNRFRKRLHRIHEDISDFVPKTIRQSTGITACGAYTHSIKSRHVCSDRDVRAMHTQRTDKHTHAQTHAQGPHVVFVVAVVVFCADSTEAWGIHPQKGNAASHTRSGRGHSSLFFFVVAHSAVAQRGVPASSAAWVGALLFGNFAVPVQCRKLCLQALRQGP